MFWWGILCTRTACKLPLQVAKHLNKSTNPELESYKGTALAGFEPMTICFRDCFKMPRELGGVQVKNHCAGLRPAPPLAEARVTQLATASFRDQILPSAHCQNLTVKLGKKPSAACPGSVSFCERVSNRLHTIQVALLHQPEDIRCQLQHEMNETDQLPAVRMIPKAGCWPQDQIQPLLVHKRKKARLVQNG